MNLYLSHSHVLMIVLELSLKPTNKGVRYSSWPELESGHSVELSKEVQSYLCCRDTQPRYLSSIQVIIQTTVNQCSAPFSRSEGKPWLHCKVRLQYTVQLFGFGGLRSDDLIDLRYQGTKEASRAEKEEYTVHLQHAGFSHAPLPSSSADSDFKYPLSRISCGNVPCIPVLQSGQTHSNNIHTKIH